MNYYNLPNELKIKILLYEGTLYNFFYKLKKNYLLKYKYYNKYYIYNELLKLDIFKYNCFCHYKNIKNCKCGKIYCNDNEIKHVITKDITYELFQNYNKFYRFIPYYLFNNFKKYNMFLYIENHYYNLHNNLNNELKRR